MKHVHPEQLRSWLSLGETTLIDVRDPGEHQSGYIDGSYLIPLATISRVDLPTSKKTIVIHCRSGARSTEACRKILAEDPSLELYNLEGGILAWMQAGYSINKPVGKTRMTLERQVHFVAGMLAFVGVVLGGTLAPGFFVLAGGVGFGLMMSGLTGSCFMGRVLRKMPWNRQSL